MPPVYKFNIIQESLYLLHLNNQSLKQSFSYTYTNKDKMLFMSLPSDTSTISTMA